MHQINQNGQTLCDARILFTFFEIDLKAQSVSYVFTRSVIYSFYFRFSCFMFLLSIRNLSLFLKAVHLSPNTY